MKWCRHVLGCLIAAALALAPSVAHPGQTIAFNEGYRPGTIVIVTHSRQLFYVLGNGSAIRYPVGVGKAGMAWHGHANIDRKLMSPAWQAPPEIAGRNNPVIPGDSPQNPMGAAVLGLSSGNYAIHGTNDPSSVGHFVSHGCIRMHNADILDLYSRTHVGTDVVVLD